MSPSNLLPIKVESKKTRKVNPIWQDFSPLHPTHPEYHPNTYVCLLCHELNENSKVSLGKSKNISPTCLVDYLRSNHPEQYQDYLSKKCSSKAAAATVSPPSSLDVHLVPKVDIISEFHNLYAWWIVEESQKFTVGLSPLFKAMIALLNRKVSIPDRLSLMKLLDEKKAATTKSTQVNVQQYICAHC